MEAQPQSLEDRIRGAATCEALYNEIKAGRSSESVMWKGWRISVNNERVSYRTVLERFSDLADTEDLTEPQLQALMDKIVELKPGQEKGIFAKLAAIARWITGGETFDTKVDTLSHKVYAKYTAEKPVSDIVKDLNQIEGELEGADPFRAKNLEIKKEEELKRLKEEVQNLKPDQLDEIDSLLALKVEDKILNKQIAALKEGVEKKFNKTLQSMDQVKDLVKLMNEDGAVPESPTKQIRKEKCLNRLKECLNKEINEGNFASLPYVEELDGIKESGIVRDVSEQIIALPRWKGAKFSSSKEACEALPALSKGVFGPALRRRQVKIIFDLVRGEMQKGDLSNLEGVAKAKLTGEEKKEIEVSLEAGMKNYIASLSMGGFAVFGPVKTREEKIMEAMEKIDELPKSKDQWVQEMYGKMHSKLREGLRKPYEIYESGNTSVSCTVIQSDLKEDPDHHLSVLGRLTENISEEFSLSVIFLDDYMEESKGMDAGGLRRQYLNDLFEGFADGNSYALNCERKGAFLCFKARQAPSGVKAPTLNQTEKALYQDIGTLLWQVYNSKEDEGLTIGRHFPDSMFKMMLSLSEEELKAGFNNLPNDRKMEMISILIQSEGKKGGHIKRMADVLALDPTKITDGEAENAFYAAGMDADEWKPFSGAVVKERWSEVRAEVQENLNLIYGGQLAPIFAVAQGMQAQSAKANKDWKDMQNVGDKKVADKVMGSIDRKFIAGQLEFSESVKKLPDVKKSVMEQKTKWLQELIQSDKDFSEEELKQFLTFLTGSSALPKDQKITVELKLPRKDAKGKKVYDPEPRIHTCTYVIDLPPVFTKGDDTKEKFKTALKACMQASGFSEA